jgi:chromosome segregation ATPase
MVKEKKPKELNMQTERMGRETDMLTSEQLLKEVEKLKGKIELLEGAREQLNDRFSSISEEVGDLRRMILDREQSQRELEVEFEKVKDAVEQIEPVKIAKDMEKFSGEIEKISARVERNEQLFRNIDEEVKKVREILSKFKSFENLVDLENRIKEKASKIEETGRYTERMASKAEGIFADLNEKLLAVKDKLETITKVDELTKDIVKEVDQLNLKFEKDVVKSEDLEKFKQSLRESIEKTIETKTGLSEEKIKSKIEEVVEKFLETHKKEGSDEEIRNKLKELSMSLKELEKKTLQQKSELENAIKRVESFLQTFKSPDDLIEERKKILKLLEKVESDYKSGSLKRESYKEIREATEKRLEAIDAVLERITEESIYKKIKSLENNVNAILEKSATYVSKGTFDGIVKKLFKELDALSESYSVIGELGKNVKKLLNSSKLTSERLDLIEKRVHLLQERLAELSEMRSHIDAIKERLEKNRKSIESIRKTHESKKIKKRSEIDEINRKIAEIFNRIISIERKQDELLEHKEKINPSDITKLLNGFARLENEIESLKVEKADVNDLLQMKKSFENVVKRNTEIIEKFLREASE